MKLQRLGGGGGGLTATGHYVITVHFRLTADDRYDGARCGRHDEKSSREAKRDAAARQWRAR